jgi:type I restriction enzyme R subunit
MIEFKQIIGRGTRLYDGKDYFTIYDFVKAHHHFSDPEWDGEPMEPEPARCVPAASRRRRCHGAPARGALREPATCVYDKREILKVKLADGKERTLQHIMATTFWHPDGTPMSARQFMEALFGKLPEFFADEENCALVERSRIPAGKLLEGLAERASATRNWPRCRRSSMPRSSDLFDVLAYVALCAGTADPRGTRGQGEGSDRRQVQLTAAGVS